MTSLVLPPTCTKTPTSTKTTSLRRYSYSCNQPNCTVGAPPLPPRRNTTAAPPALSVNTTVTQPSAMTSRYGRPSSPRGRFSNPARSSTGTFDPYYDSNYYGRPSSPRTSGERIGSSYYPQHTHAPSSSTSSRSSAYKYDSYSGRPRRNTLTESEDRSIWPNVPPPALPVRPHASLLHHDRPSSPLARTWDSRPDTYITYPPGRREHKRIYSVDDNSHSTKLVAEKDIVESRRRDHDDRGYSTTSSGRSYHSHKPAVRTSDVGDDSYSYTDPASMYRDTEPAWRRPRSGSVERGSRPTSMIVDRAPRTSTRELGPPPSTRGFDKINNTVNRSGSHHRGRSPSVERSRDAPSYDAYPEPHSSRPTSYHAPVISQEPRRDAYRNDYVRPDRDVENRRYAPVDQFDPDVAKRGFGIASPTIAHAPEPSYQSHWSAQEAPRSRPAEYADQYYSSDRAEARMPEPRIPREKEGSSTYEERPRDRDRDRREVGHPPPQSALPTVAGAVAGAAATVGGAALLKARNKDRDSERGYDRDREMEKEREQRREWDERDRRDRAIDDRREDRRDRNSDDRRDRALEDRRDRVPQDRRDRDPEERVAPVPIPAAYAPPPPQEPSRKPRERRSDDDERERRSRKAPSSEGSGDERPRHYVERDVAKESEYRREPAPALDPDEEYRRRIQLEAERSGRGREAGDTDREKDRQRRREEREKSRDRAEEHRSRGSPSNVTESSRSRYEDRDPHILDTNMVQEPDSMSMSMQEQPSRSVQIVAPPKEPPPQPKGILRKPTEKFPEEPEPVREGVAPHKSQLKGKDIPVNARWTKIDRKLVNPEALDDAKERYEERLDCVIVLRVLTKQEIQKLADRTKEIREAREDEYERRDHRDRDSDRRSSRRHRDEEDRDRRRDYDDDEDDIGRDRDRDRERGRDRPRAIEDGR